MTRTEAYYILERMWLDGTKEQREAISIAQDGIVFMDKLEAGNPHWSWCPMCHSKMMEVNNG